MTSRIGSGESEPLVLSLSGEFDVAKTDDVLARGEVMLRGAQPGQRLVVEVGQLQFIDSSGLNALIRLRRSAQNNGVGIALRNTPQPIAALLRLSGLEEVLPTTNE